jgi:hypothetical protein
MGKQTFRQCFDLYSSRLIGLPDMMFRMQRTSDRVKELLASQQQSVHAPARQEN